MDEPILNAFGCSKVPTVGFLKCSKTLRLTLYIYIYHYIYIYYIIAMENGPFVEYFRIKTSIYGWDFLWLC